MEPQIDTQFKVPRNLSDTNLSDTNRIPSTNKLKWPADWPSSRVVKISKSPGGDDRHGKEGVRDRRIRLSAFTAIQFYDLQDRLGYDRPNKAVEWLLRAAESSVAELPSLDLFSNDIRSSGDTIEDPSYCQQQQNVSVTDWGRPENIVKPRERAQGSVMEIDEEFTFPKNLFDTENLSEELDDEDDSEAKRIPGMLADSPSSRIVRVSRAAGGKDRHSKVWTSKGLRDRRIRLSVNTATQFYDLQDRLGYDRPSKAVEWLLRAAESSIAELPSFDLLFSNDIRSGGDPSYFQQQPKVSSSDSDNSKQHKMKRDHSISTGGSSSITSDMYSTGKSKMKCNEPEQDAGVDELLAVLGYKVKSSDMADVAEKLQHLEEAMGQAQQQEISQLGLDPKLISDIVKEVKLKINPSEDQADKMEVQLEFPKTHYTLSNIEELLHLLGKDLKYDVLKSKHVAVKNLKVMDIWVSELSKIPDNISFPDLEKLVMHSNLDLSCIPSSFFERMPVLKELNMSSTRIKSLPPSVFTLIKLEKLILQGCDQLIEIPHEINALGNLTALDLTGCTNLVEFPESIDFPQSLSSLDLTRCESLTKLPPSINKLRFLKYIHLSGCSSLFGSCSAELPINRLSWDNQADKMEIQMDNQERHGFDLSKFIGIVKRVLEYNFLQKQFVTVRNLKAIHISNSMIPEIPDSVSFPDLEELILQPNLKLSYIPSSLFGKMPDLRVLDLSNASMKYLPTSVVKFKKLEKLILKGCIHLVEIPHDIGVLGTLKELNLSGCKSLIKLPEGTSKLRFLNNLNLSGCEHLMEIPDNIGVLVGLKELDLSGCKSLVKLPESISKLRYLTNLNLSGCENFAEIPVSFVFPPALYTLDLTDCKQLRKLPESVCRLGSLEELNLSGCTSLSEIPESFKLLQSLSKLYLTNCRSLTALPDSISMMRRLTHLILSGCENFAEFPDSFEFPPNLESLDLTNCKRLTKLPEIVGELQFLQYLRLSGCENWAEFPKSFAKLQKVHTLELKDCKIWTKLPESVCKLTCLETLNLSGCTNMAEIPESIKLLKRLNSLVLTDCKSLTKLPNSISELGNLKHLELSGCLSLFEFREPQVSVKCLSWNTGDPDRKHVQLDFHETQGTPADFTEILSLMERVLQHPLLKSEGIKVAVIKLEVIHMSNSKLPKIPKKLSFPDLKKLVLQPNFAFSSITSSFFRQMPAFDVLDMSHSIVKTLPSCVCELTDLKELILQSCELLIKLDGIGALKNLEVLDAEGTDIVYLPDELGNLINLKRLKVSLYDAESYRKSREIVDIIPTAVLSKLTELEELCINVEPQDVWCRASLKAIIEHLPSLSKLKSLKVYLPTTELLQNLVELKWSKELKCKEEFNFIYRNLSNFSVIIGPHPQRFISRLPCDLEEEYLKLEKCLKYIGGKDKTSDFTEALKHANALYLDRHWNIHKLSVFKVDELNNLKFCMMVDCNKMQTVFNASDFNLEDNILSLQYLAIHYSKNLVEIWKGPGVGCCLQLLKVLVLHMCPNLTTILTWVLLEDLVNLKEIIVEDCPKITSLIAEASTQLTAIEYLPSLKRLSLLYLPELESISSGIIIGPELENVVIYDCPKLKRLPSQLGVCNGVKINGETEWWDALEWSDDQPCYPRPAFSELDVDELATQYVNSLRLCLE